jgi:hypothetical protein
MFIKENFWIGARGGLMEEKHYLCMRDSVWFFLFLLLKQTGVNEAGEGIVNHGHPMTRAFIEDETGFHQRRIEDWISRLRRTRYIRTESRNKDGLIFFVLEAKHKTRLSRISVPVIQSQARNNGSVPLERASQQSENKRLECKTSASNPKGLSYSNKDAAAQIAAGISSLARGKEIPKPKSWEQQKAELRERWPA